MIILLDTHTFLWFIDGDPNLSAMARSWIENPNAVRYLSIASLWEIAIKVSINKLQANMTISDLVMNHVLANGIQLLAVLPPHLDTISTLAFHHRDPFDRLMIAQAIVENATIIGNDVAFDAYPIKRIW